MPDPSPSPFGRRTPSSVAGLYPLLTEAGFHDVQVSPRIVYVDSSRPALVGRVQQEHVHRHGGRGERPGPRHEHGHPRGLAKGNRRPLPRHRGRRHLLLYVLQGRRTESGPLSPSKSYVHVRRVITIADVSQSVSVSLARTSSAMARQAVSPGLSMPIRCRTPGTFGEWWNTKSEESLSLAWMPAW